MFTRAQHRHVSHSPASAISGLNFIQQQIYYTPHNRFAKATSKTFGCLPGDTSRPASEVSGSDYDVTRIVKRRSATRVCCLDTLQEPWRKPQILQARTWRKHSCLPRRQSCRRWAEPAQLSEHCKQPTHRFLTPGTLPPGIVDARVETSCRRVRNFWLSAMLLCGADLHLQRASTRFREIATKVAPQQLDITFGGAQR